MTWMNSAVVADTRARAGLVAAEAPHWPIVPYAEDSQAATPHGGVA